MSFEDAFDQIARKLEYEKYGSNAWVKSLPDLWLCLDAGRDQFNQKKGLHHPSLRACYGDWVNKLPQPHQFPVALYFHYLIEAREQKKFLSMVNDEESEDTTERETYLIDELPRLIVRAEGILGSKADISKYLEEEGGKNLHVFGPALELKGKVWDAPWPPT